LCPAPLLSSLRLTCDFTWKKTGGHQVVDLEWKIPSINGFLYLFFRWDFPNLPFYLQNDGQQQKCSKMVD